MLTITKDERQRPQTDQERDGENVSRLRKDAGQHLDGRDPHR